MPTAATADRSAAETSANTLDPKDGKHATIDGRTTGESGAENTANQNGASNPERKDAGLELSRRQAAVQLLEEIGKEFGRLRQDGRSGAWAALEDRLMLNGHLLVSAGLLS